jgi:hypothetical protein
LAPPQVTSASHCQGDRSIWRSIRVARCARRNRRPKQQAQRSEVAQLFDAGLNLSLAPAGGLAVTPSSHLTADLRDLIRSSKAMLIDWLTAANDAASRATDPPDKPLV